MDLLIKDKQLSEHFWLHEMASKGNDGEYVVQDISTELFCIALEKLRVWYNKPISPSSWCRSTLHNNLSGGSVISQHLTGTAIDMLYPSNEDLLQVLFSDRQTEWLTHISDKWKEIVNEVKEEYATVIKQFNINMNTGIFWYWWGIHVGIGQYTEDRFHDYRYSTREMIK